MKISPSLVTALVRELDTKAKAKRDSLYDDFMKKNKRQFEIDARRILRVVKKEVPKKYQNALGISSNITVSRLVDEFVFNLYREKRVRSTGEFKSEIHLLAFHAKDEKEFRKSLKTIKLFRD